MLKSTRNSFAIETSGERAPFGTAQMLLFLTALALIGLSFSFVVFADPDLWGHTKFGLDHVLTGKLLRTDIYSFTATGRPWVNQEWLTEWIFGLCFLWKKDTGLFLLRMVILNATMAGVVTLLWARWRNPVFVSLSTFVTTSYLFCLTWLRPQSFTNLLMVLFLVCLEEFRKGNKYSVFLMPPLMALWVNLHGGFVVGLGVATLGLLALFFGLEGQETKPTTADKRLLLKALFLTYAATLLNPYGIRIFFFLWEVLPLDRHHITEWLPVSGPAGQVWFSSSIAMITVLHFFIIKPVRVAQMMLFAAVGFEFVMHKRFSTLFVVLASLVAADLAVFLWKYLIREHPFPLFKIPESSRGRLVLLVVINFLLFMNTVGVLPNAVWRIRIPVLNISEHGRKDGMDYPSNAVAFLKHHALGPNLAVWYDWGEYAIWHLFPRYRVSIDGRYENLYDPEKVHRVLHAAREGNIKDYLQDYKTDAILIEAGTPLDKALATNNRWFNVYRDRVAAVYVPGGRFGSAALQEIVRDASRISRKRSPRFFP